MSDKPKLGIAMRFIEHFNAEEELASSLNPLSEANRALALGPSRGPDDTLARGIEFLREQDAKAVQH